MQQDFLEKWINQEEHAQVALLSAPITFPPVPSIALSIFQAGLDEAGISSRVIYSMFPTNHLLGVKRIYEVDRVIDLKNNGEFLFAHMTDAAAACSMEEFADIFLHYLEGKDKEEALAFLEHGKRVAECIVDAVSRRIIHMGARIVAASSVFSQQNASLAILKRVKELDPTITTILGGYNVSGDMGKAIHQNYPSVDYISFGEGDDAIIETCKILLGRKEGPMPYGVVGQKDVLPEKIPYCMTQNLNLVPTPVYRDFFEEIDREAAGYYGDIPKYYGETYEHVIFLEGSRGCWWGARHACTFCGLNGLNNVYREKTPERLYEEIQESIRQYPGANIQLADNVLSQNMVKNLLPMLAAAPHKAALLAEIKVNLKPEDVQWLNKAGVTVTQPGIESLNDHLLNLMGKGSTAVQNVALLKYCRTYQVLPVWNMMFGVPGENREDFEQIMELIPLVHHLYPPTRANDIAFNRFSKYTDHPDDYGLELEPAKLYKCCYKGHDDLIQNMGIYYDLVGGPFLQVKMQNRDLYGRLDLAVREWRKLTFSEKRPMLAVIDSFMGYLIYDTRPIAPVERSFLLGLSAKVYKMAFEPVLWETLCKKLPDVSEEALKKVLDNLIERKLMVYLSGHYLALAVPAGTN